MKRSLICAVSAVILASDCVVDASICAWAMAPSAEIAPTRRRVDSSNKVSSALVLRLDRAAQLGLAGVELLAPAPGRGVEDRGGVFRAIPDQGGQSFARTGQPVFQDLTAHDDGVVKAVGGVVEARDEAVAMDDDGVGKPGAAGLESLDERIRPDAEVADDRSRSSGRAGRRPSRPGRGSPRRPQRRSS